MPIRVAASKEAALVLSLIFNVVACAAIWRMWKSRVVLEERITTMLTDLVAELGKLMASLREKQP